MLERMILKLNISDIRKYSCGRCGNPYLKPRQTNIGKRIWRYLSGYEFLYCGHCHSRCRIEKGHKRAA